MRRFPGSGRSFLAFEDLDVLIGLRAALLLLGTVGMVLALPGLVAHEVFRQPTLTKYAVSILAPLFLVILGLVRHPLRIAVAAIIVCAPVGTEVATFSGTAIPLQAVLVGLGVVVAVLMSPLRGRLSPTGRLGVVAIALLAEPLFAGADPLFNIVWIAAIVTIAWLVSLTVSEPGGAVFVGAALVFSALIQSVIAIYEYHTGHLINLYGSAGAQNFGKDYFFTYGTANRPVGLFTDPNSLGNVLALALPLTVYVVSSTTNALLKLFAILAGVLIAVSLTLSLSRMSWVGGAAGVVTTLALLPRGHRRAATLTTVGLALFALIIGSASLGLNISKRVQSIFHPTSGANSHSISNPGEDVDRTRLWAAALSIFAEHPIVGVGLNHVDPFLARKTGGINRYSEAQSEYFQMLAEGGLLGGLALVLVCAGVVVGVIRGLRIDRRLAAGIAGSLVALILASTTDSTVGEISVGTFFGVLIGLAAYLSGSASAART